METNLNILPFGQMVITIKSSKIVAGKRDQNVVYSEPRTTEQSVVEVELEGNYSAPETTVGS